MRLNGRREILRHLGRNQDNRRGWRRVRQDYAPALHYLPGSLRVWTTTDELDVLDRARSLTVEAVLGRDKQDSLGRAVGERNRNAWRQMMAALGNPDKLIPKR